MYVYYLSLSLQVYLTEKKLDLSTFNFINLQPYMRVSLNYLRFYFEL